MKNIFTLTLLVIFALSCHDESNFRSSENIDNPADRIETLRNYISLKSELIDAEYNIFDVNLNSNRSIPGPSSRDYKIALLIDKNNIANWLQDLNTSSFQLDYDWIYDLIKSNDNFYLSSKPIIYTGENTELILFEEESIIFIRIVQD